MVHFSPEHFLLPKSNIFISGSQTQHPAEIVNSIKNINETHSALARRFAANTEFERFHDSDMVRFLVKPIMIYVLTKARPYADAAVSNTDVQCAHPRVKLKSDTRKYLA